MAARTAQTTVGGGGKRKQRRASSSAGQHCLPGRDPEAARSGGHRARLRPPPKPQGKSKGPLESCFIRTKIKRVGKISPGVSHQGKWPRGCTARILRARKLQPCQSHPLWAAASPRIREAGRASRSPRLANSPGNIKYDHRSKPFRAAKTISHLI